MDKVLKMMNNYWRNHSAKNDLKIYFIKNIYWRRYSSSVIHFINNVLNIKNKKLRLWY